MPIRKTLKKEIWNLLTFLELLGTMVKVIYFFIINIKVPQEIYLDHAASTPLNPQVWQKMQAIQKEFGNPSSIHQIGQRAKNILSQARRKIAQLCDCYPQEIIFTPSATISNNIILQGIAFQEKNKIPHFITTSLEHPSISDTFAALEKQKKITLSLFSVGKDGIVNPLELETMLQENTKLVSVTSASGEIGSLQPIAQIAKITKKNGVLLHTDATQFIGAQGLPSKNVDAFTIASHKIYGPKGAAMLFLRDGVDLKPIFYGGGQEKNLVAGTENIMAIVGFAEALEISLKKQKTYQQAMQKLTTKLDELIAKEIPSAILVGSVKNRLAFHRNYIFPNHLAEEVLIHLDLEKIYLSSKSACSSGRTGASTILLSMGYNEQQALCSLRITTGYSNTEKQLIHFVSKLKMIFNKLQKNEYLGNKNISI